MQRKIDTEPEYILGLEGSQKTITSFLHSYLKEEHALVSKIRWSILTYHRKNMICYLNPIKNDGIELAFSKGNELSNAQGLLRNKRRKFVAGIDIYSLKEIDLVHIGQIINEAIILDDLST